VVYDGLVEELPARLDGRRVELAPGAARSYRATLYLPATAPAGYAGDAAGITLTIG
jgi:hypothetical protein